MMKLIALIIPTFIGVCLLSYDGNCQAQSEEKVLVYETFRTYYLVNGHSTETLYPRDLFFNISHRFGGYISDGVQEFFGMDSPSNVRLELMYGLTENLDIGVGRSSFLKIYDGTVKYRLIQQVEKGFPATISLLGSAATRTKEWSEQEKQWLDARHRWSYLMQAMISSKLSESISLQLSPSYIHRNLVGEIEEKNDLFGLGVGASVKITHSISIKTEYNHRFSEGSLLNKELYHSFGLSFDIANERHSYQIQFANNTGLIGQEYIPSTQDDFFGGDIHLGFRITRKFAL